jgi:hypothetical protein
VRTVLALVFACGVLGTATARAQVHAAWLGEWHLNLARSTYDPGPAPYRRASYRIEPWQDGLKVVNDMVRVRGGVVHMEWTGRFDGRDYPVQGVEDAVTYAYRPVDERAYDIVIKLDGRPTAVSHAVLAPDGSSITTTTTGRDARGVSVTTVTVYEKAR